MFHTLKKCGTSFIYMTKFILNFNKKSMNRKLLITICFLLFTSYAANAQSPSWQWGKRGGSSSSGSGGVDATVVDMATDPHGNVYVLSKVLQTGLNVDGH